MERIDNYIQQCQEKIEYHTQAGGSYTQLDRINAVVGILLTAGLSLTMTVLTATKTEDLSVTIIGSIFAFAISINNKISSTYDFRVIASRHYDASDEYTNLKYTFESISQEHEISPYTTVEYRAACKEYIRIQKWNHLEACNSCC